ncbi:hypothetical protein CH252_19160 [Rhodococcus sp. 06-1477-1B]|nr:hypothetical protein CH252_19160 [Rhodococcus sp. 06-1477-1B]
MPFIPLPAGTTLGKSFEYGLDVNLATYASPQFQSCRRISAWAPTYPPVSVDAGTYDDAGVPNNDIAGRGFSGAFTIQANRNLSTGLYLPEVEAIMAAGKAIGDAAVLDVRFYHKPAIGTPNPTDAGRALVTVEISRANTGNADVENISVSLTSKGAYLPIANPYVQPGASAVPSLTSATPAGASAGQQVAVSGVRLLGVTAMKVGAVTVTTFTVLNDGTIVFVMPAGSAGAAAITVTNAAGTSVALPYTRGA